MATEEAPEEQEEELLTIDDARDFLYSAYRSCERFAEDLKKIVDDLNLKKNHDAWLEPVQTECIKGVTFHEQQVLEWQNFSTKFEAFVEIIRKEANEIALEELRQDKEGGEGEAGMKTPASLRRESKILHPELHKFKLEKQAKILGKYGGTPAMGGGLIMPRLPRGSVLKATASPAAREIHYSKMENTDARHLADVIQFRTNQKKIEVQQTDWQETVAKKKALQDEDEDGNDGPPRTPLLKLTPLGTDLTSALKSRKSQIADIQAATEAAAKAAALKGDDLASATPVLADKLKKRLSTVAGQDTETAANPPPPTEDQLLEDKPVAEAGTPFGSELAAILQRRNTAAAAAAAAASANADATPPAKLPPRPPSIVGASPELAALLKKRQSIMPDDE